MSLRLSNLSISFGSKKVLDELSLNFKKGEIVGLVGVNGAGKTTLLKVIAGLIRQDEGEVNKNGTVGYLSERNPLYPNMYVLEYLNWLSKLKLESSKSLALDDIIKNVRIRNVLGQKINTLSKGYRQRVGLAATLLNDPDILLLDEPINGLDPVQISEYHSLIRGLRKNRIIILSSHLMQEIEALCDRVIKIESGKIVTNTAISQQSEFARIRVEFDREIKDVDAMKKLSSIKSIERLGKGAFVILSEDDRKGRLALFDFAMQEGVRILEMTRDADKLKDLFE